MSMDFEQIIYTKQEGIANITLNRPEVLNAISSKMIDEIVFALKDIQEDDEVRVVILTGAGRAFCSGADLRAIIDGNDNWISIKPSAVEIRNQGRFGIQRIPHLFESLEKPCIASINGLAMGAGFDLASMCDIRIASEKSRFSINHLRVCGLSLDGGYYFLVRILGIPKALEFVWTWDTFNAQEALQIGYVNRVVSPEILMDATKEFAHRLVKGPPVAIQMAKRLIYKAWNSNLNEALENVESAWAILRTSEDAMEGTKAWLEKREPQFKGK